MVSSLPKLRYGIGCSILEIGPFGRIPEKLVELCQHFSGGAWHKWRSRCHEPRCKRQRFLWRETRALCQIVDVNLFPDCTDAKWVHWEPSSSPRDLIYRAASRLATSYRFPR